MSSADGLDAPRGRARRRPSGRLRRTGRSRVRRRRRLEDAPTGRRTARAARLVPAGRGRGRHPQPGAVVRGHPRGDRGPGLPRPHASSSSTAAPTTTPPRGSPRASRTRSCGGSTRTPASRPPPTRRCDFVEGATFLLLCHDDVVPDAAAVRLLVEEAYRSNAGIVGPKLVSADDPKVLLEVGRAIDRFGAPYTGIEPGEFDQEQHDGVRDVFYVTTATMLVRVDLFTELGGFRSRDVPRRRGPRPLLARPARGARVLVAPGRAGRRTARRPTSAGAPTVPDETALVRAAACASCSPRTRSSRCCGSSRSGIVVGLVEALGHLVDRPPAGGTRRRSRAGSRTSSTCAASARRASARRSSAHVRDRDLRELQIGSATRLGVFFSHHLQTDERLRSFGDRGRSAVGTVSDGLRGADAFAVLGFVVVVLVGSRKFISGGVPGNRHAGALAVDTAISSTPSGPRGATRGSARHHRRLRCSRRWASLGTVLFGSVGLARTLLVVAALPLGAVRRVPIRAEARRPPRTRARGRRRVRREPGRPQRDRLRSVRPARCSTCCSRSCSAESSRLEPARRRRDARGEPARSRRSGAAGSSDSRCW